MFHLKLKDTLKHSIATVTSHMDSFVYNPGRDYSRIRKLSPDHVICGSGFHGIAYIETEIY